jgi:glycosyltransferase involved in cell wall biosynthesis
MGAGRLLRGLRKQMKLSDKVTIVIPCKNEEDYISHLLKSLQQQGIEDTRVIIADCSTDNTRQVITDNSSSLNVEIIDGGPVSLAKNNGARLVTTPYILFIDADVRFFKNNVIQDAVNEIVFKDLLDWLNKNLWLPNKVDPAVMEVACKSFYQTKTLDRLQLYTKKYPNQATLSLINGETIPSVEDLLPLINWSNLYQGVPCFMHGDLQFDNILFNPKTKSFLLLDWRQDFSGHINFGDIYYDLAKLYGGILLNYDYIKLNLLTYSEDSCQIFFDFPQRYKTNSYLAIYDTFLNENSFNLNKVKLLVALIYLNMAPLHHYPFDKLLHALGRKLLFKEVNTSE